MGDGWPRPAAAESAAKADDGEKKDDCIAGKAEIDEVGKAQKHHHNSDNNSTHVDIVPKRQQSCDDDCDYFCCHFCYDSNLR